MCASIVEVENVPEIKRGTKRCGGDFGPCRILLWMFRGQKGVNAIPLAFRKDQIGEAAP